MNAKTEGSLALIAAFFVLFSNFLAPQVSLVIAMSALLVLGIYNIFLKK